MIGTKITGLMAAILGMPVLSFISPETVMEKLAVGSAQIVLAVVAVCLSRALLHVYKLHREDALSSREELKSMNRELQKVVAENAISQTQLLKSNDELRAAIQHLSETLLIHQPSFTHRRKDDPN